VRSSAGIAQDARQVQPEDHEDHAADLAEDRHPLRQTGGGERSRDPEQREDHPEPADVGEGVAERRPARRQCRAAAGGHGGARHGDRGQLAEIGGHERQDARAEEADQPAVSATRIVRLSALTP
jgi:hypothetical protein